MPKHLLKNRQAALLTALIAVSFATTAQQLPRTVPATYPVGVKSSYVRSWTASVPETDPNNLILATRPLREVKQSTQYVDGLGRPIQTVVENGSLETGGSAADMISSVEYDVFGREQFKYLPTPSTAVDGTKTDGSFKLNPFAQQAVFYGSTATNAPLLNQAETFYYGQTIFEASPLNRVSETAAPGNSWAGSMGQVSDASRRSVKMKYYLNTTTDKVRMWTVNVGPLGGFSTYVSPSVYPANSLFKNITIDERNNQVIEFKDKEGKVILKKVQLTASADLGTTGVNHAGWLCTYYLYDNLNNLRCVIQPKALELLNVDNWTVFSFSNGTMLAEQCFRYEYDQRNRMIIKKVPGAAEVYMVYDVRDRLVMTQDGNLRAINKWMVTLYDFLNRPVQTGLLSNTYNTPATAKTFVQHLTDANTSSAYPFALASTPTTTYWEYLTKTGYDNYDNIPAASSLTKTYDPLYNAYLNAGTASPDFADAPITAASINIKGVVTWTETKVLDKSIYTYAVVLYDEKGRTAQVKTKNLTSGFDIACTQFTWTGQPIITVQKTDKGGGSAQANVVATKNTYDDLGRITQVDKKIGNSVLNTITNLSTAAYTTISTNKYDALGRLISKKMAPAYNSPAGLETMAYSYNIRGWLLGVNRGYLNNASTSKFGFELAYDKQTSMFDNNVANTYIKGQYNGNITGTVWKSVGDGKSRKYDFDYDAVNRLTIANFTQYNAGWNVNDGVDFSVGGSTAAGIQYDANGNILQMWQKGLKLMTSDWVDQLSYSYFTNSNKLQAVTDAITADNKLGDFTDKNTTTTDYGYDVNGNMVTDLNKTITGTTGATVTTGGAITYNYLNLPATIAVTAKGNISYIYDAAGSKLQKVTTENNASVTLSPTTYTGVTIVTTTTYLNGFVFESKAFPNNATLAASTLAYTDKLQLTGHEEGRIRALYASSTTPNTLTGLMYDYMIKDHLGNVRMVLTEEVTQNTYPAATLEGTFDATTNSMVNFEKQFYKIDNTKITPESAIASWVSPAETTANTKLYYNNNGNPPANTNYPSGCVPVQTAGSNNLYKLDATTNRTGLEFMIKVMAGDNIDIFGKSYFLNTATVNNTNSTALDLGALMANMILAPANGAAGKGLSSANLTTINSPVFPGSFFRGTNGETTTIPKAYINYVFFDEQFKYAGGGASRVGSSGIVTDHWQSDPSLRNIAVPKNGYLFVYVSNETNLPVYFDNLQVIHKPGPIIEETHYYPFGLTMAGISSKAVGSLINKNKFGGKELQSQEFSDGSGLDVYDYGAREQDPQLGRWWTIDPLAERYNYSSPYHFAGNNPIRYREVDGKFFEDTKQHRVKLDINKDGTLKWGKNATDDMKRIGAAMAKSEVGLKALTAMKDAKHGVSMEIDTKTIKKDADGKYIRGETSGTAISTTLPDGSKKIELTHQKIVVFEATIKEQMAVGGENGKTDFGGKLYDNNGLGLEDRIGSVVVHEAYHATDAKSNPTLNPKGTDEQWNRKPYQEQQNFLDDILKKN